MTILLALSLAMWLHPQIAPGTPVAPSREDVIVINGHKNPSKIPQWVAWESGFSIVDAWTGRDSGFTHELRGTLTREEFSLMEREAAAQATRREEAGREVEQLRPGLAAIDPKDTAAVKKLTDQVHAIDLKYRRATLAARDRVLQALSPASQAVVQAWIEQGKSTIVCQVPSSELAHWRSPE